MEIYADVLFLINFTVSYLMLALLGAVTRNKAKQKRLLLAAGVGGILSVVCFLTGRLGGVIRAAGALLMTAAAFGTARLFERTIIFTAISALVSAVFAAISSVFGDEVVYVKNGTAYFDLPEKTFAVTLIAAYLFTVLIFKVIKRKNGTKIHTLTVKFKDGTINVKALSDSGNALREPISGKSVVVAEWQTVRPLFNGAEYEDLINNMDRYRLRIVPYHSLGNENGMIFAFLADDIVISDEKRSTGKIYIGITHERLSKTNEYNALIGASV